MLLGEADQNRSLQADLPYWLAINPRSSAFTATTIGKAVERFGSLESTWLADDDQLTRVGFTATAIAQLKKIKSESNLNDFWKLADDIRSQKVQILRFIDRGYPAELKNISSALGPPIMIFRRGTHKKFDDAIAIVGTRNCSFYGRTMARQISKKLAEKGFLIVSGLARGVDEEAHCGALESKRGNTLAVLAWFDPVYPDEHSELVKEIENRGARISENYTKSFGSMTAGKFVERNRITSGITKFVVAIETDADGGTIRQIELANQQNRPVFVLKPKENKRAWNGYNHIVENLKGIAFEDIDQLLNHIRERKLEPSSKLSDYSLDPQLRLR
jgi:DNA processing protein